MKLKKDISDWVAEVRQMKEKTEKTLQSADDFKTEVLDLKNQVSKLLEITERMADTMLSLLRQQMGD